MAIADDSGLVADALNGEPGVYSARYAGVHGDDAANNAKLLVNLEGVADEDRTARFMSVAALIDHGRFGHLWRGRLRGRYRARGPR